MIFKRLYISLFLFTGMVSFLFSQSGIRPSGTYSGGGLQDLPALRVRASNPRLIEDVNGMPFFFAGSCPQSMIHDCNSSDVDAFFANRQAKHFNVAQVDIFAPGAGNNLKDPTDVYGNHFFLNGESFDSSNINNNYMKSLDYIISSAANHNQYVMINLPDFKDDFTVKIPFKQWYHLGQYLGKRWKDCMHVMFMFGNDYFVSSLENQLWTGIKQSMPNALTTTDDCYGDNMTSVTFLQPYDYRYISAPDSNFTTSLSWLTLDGWYHYRAPSYMAAQEYNRPNVTMPSFIAEAQYENETFGANQWNQSDGSARMIRNELWAEVLWGGSGFGIYGSDNWGVVSTMTNLNQAGAYSSQYCTDFFSSRAWYNLVPDKNHLFLTSQSGMPSMKDETYVSAALTSDGTFGAIYYPGNSGSSFSMTINMAKMSGTTTARWYDPSNATYKSINGSPFANSGSQTFNIPGGNSAGNNDWVLVLEAII